MMEIIMYAVRVHQHGGAEALTYEDVPTPTPGSGEVLINVEAAGVNFIDIYHRTGLYPNTLPLTLGVELAGVIEAVSPDVDLNIGDRVACVNARGAYAEYAIAPAARLVPIPPQITGQQAAAAMLQGMTAHYLTHSTYPLQPGDVALVHAAAGGTGQLVIQFAKRRGATVFGTVSTEAKAELARAAGADEVILYTQTDFEAEVKRLTSGRGVNVVYDSVGQTTFEKSLNCLRPRGLLALFGQSSGPVEPFNPAILNAKGSLFLTRPSLFHYVAERAELLERARDVFDSLLAGDLKIRIDRAYPLAEVAEAHRHIEGRGTTGKIVLVP
jgi:NADPH2:quinone reductase